MLLNLLESFTSFFPTINSHTNSNWAIAKVHTCPHFFHIKNYMYSMNSITFFSSCILRFKTAIKFSGIKLTPFPHSFHNYCLISSKNFSKKILVSSAVSLITSADKFVWKRFLKIILAKEVLMEVDKSTLVKSLLLSSTIYLANLIISDSGSNDNGESSWNLASNYLIDI